MKIVVSISKISLRAIWEKGFGGYGCAERPVKQKSFLANMSHEIDPDEWLTWNY